MPVTVVAGGQYGSEGKGKVAHALAREAGRSAVAVRVGGSNSGHTVAGPDGKPLVLRHLPTAAWLPDAQLVLPPGTYLDPAVLLDEITRTEVDPGRLAIDPNAAVIGPEDAAQERGMRLNARIGSTESGTGAAVLRRVARDGTLLRAADLPEFAPFLRDTLPLLRRRLDDGDRVIVEGTQGYGLSLLHGGHGNHATSRDTTAAGLLAETGLSPLDVDQVVLVIRAYPIRVAGQSGPLPDETTWEEVARDAGRPGLEERTTVTGRVRRVARFDPALVRRAVDANRPTSVVMNHVDYAAPAGPDQRRLADRFLRAAELSISRRIDLVGVGPAELVPRERLHTPDEHGAHPLLTRGVTAAAERG
jgi:adenylosuccinate synthase